MGHSSTFGALVLDPASVADYFGALCAFFWIDRHVEANHTLHDLSHLLII